MTRRTRSHLLSDLENLRETRLALSDRLRGILTAMAMSEEVAAELYQRLDALDEAPNGHRHSAVAAAEAAQAYRLFLAKLGDLVDTA